METLPRDAGCLSLAVGVAVVRALRAYGITGVNLKWPNDLVIDQGKVGGILIELRAEAGGTTLVVVGIGLNLSLPEVVRLRIEAEGNRAAGLSMVAGSLPGRNELVAALVNEGIQVVAELAASGFGGLRREYAASDCLRGQAISVSGHQVPWSGVAAGIDTDGALLVQTASGMRRVVSGDVSVRAAGE
jgi:BirA family biotin operon repressor/biotin-[acetyl-CoA-carboxylase] ligase